MLEKVIDILMFREGTEEDADGSLTPIITTGSIVWGVLLRAGLIIFLSFYMFEKAEWHEYWWVSLFAVWALAAYPAWRQYNKFQSRIKKIEDTTLCGSCKHFDSTGQLCRLFDEHVSTDYIPCEGLDWEPKHSDSDDY